MQIVVLAWLFAAAALAQDVPKEEATPMDSLTIAQKKEAIDQMAQKADMAADTAMAEAEKEDAEEKSIEASVGELVSDIGETGPQVSKQKMPEDEVRSKEEARARLKKAMEATLKQKNEAHQRVVALKAAKLKAIEHEKAVQHKAELKAEKLKVLEHEKSVQLANLEHEKMEVKRKLAKLEKQKSQQEAQLKQAENLKKQQAKVTKEVPSLDGFVHKAVLKKYGNRFPTEALELAAERKMKQLVEARLKRKAAPKKQAEAPKLDLDALVKKAEDSHIKKTGKRFSKDAEARLKIAFEKKLHLAVAKRMKEKAAAAPVVNANVLANIKDTSADGAEDQDDSQKTDAAAASAAKDTEDTEQDAEQGKDDSQNTNDDQHDITDEAGNDETQSTDDSKQGASEAKSQKTADSHNTEQNTEDVGDAAAAGASEQAQAEVVGKAANEDTGKADASEDVGKDATEQDTSTEEDTSTDGKDLTQDESANAAQDSTAGGEADMVDETIEPGDEEATEPSDMDDDEVAEAEVFLQKGKALRSPLFFSTEDADLQPYLHPSIPAPRVLAAKRTNRELQLQRRKRVTHDLNKASKALKQFKQKLKREERTIAAPAPGPAASPGLAPAPAVEVDPYAMCEELCKLDTGTMHSESCVTECHVYVDAGGDVDSLKDFVTHRTYNTQGGEAAEDHFEKKTGEDIPDCTPTLALDPNIEFNTVDFNGDGKLTTKEIHEWGEKACVPWRLANQIMDAADADSNGEVTPAEYNAIGEDTDFEYMIDQIADKTTEGEDQYEPVQLPAFRHADFDSDGQLDEDEVVKNFKDEIIRRIPTLTEAEVNTLAAEHHQELMEGLDHIDKNRDGKINDEEYNAVHGGGMGEELGEAASVADNNLQDPDDLHVETPAVPAAAPAPASAAASAFLAREA